MGDSYMTPDESEDITIELMASDLLALIQHVGFSEVQLLGFSMGGIISQALICHPDAKLIGSNVQVHGVTITALVLTATFAKSPKTAFNPSKMPQTEGLSRQERNLAIVRHMMAMQYDDESLKGPLKAQFERRVQLALNTRRPFQTVMGQSIAIRMSDLRPSLAKLGSHSALRVLIIHGVRDQMVDYKESEELARLLPNSVRLSPASSAGSQFGHMWYEYLDQERDWVAPLCSWLDARNARL